LTYRFPLDLLHLLMQGSIDFIATNETHHRPQLELKTWLVEEIVCVSRGPKRRLGWSALAGLAWIAYGSEDPLWYDLERMAQRHGARLPKRCSTSRMSIQ